MPTIDLGICISKYQMPDNPKVTENLIQNCLNMLFGNKNVNFISAYLYDEKSDKGVDLRSLPDTIQTILEKRIYNRILFKAKEQNLYVAIGFMEKSMTIGINMDYDSCSLLAQSETPEDLLIYLSHNLESLYENIHYQFAFADFDAEFDYSYSQLLEKIYGNNCPYCLLLIDEKKMLKKSFSSYNLLGCPIYTGDNGVPG